MKKLFFTCFVLCFCVSVFAHDFTASNTLNGIGSKTIYYRVTSPTTTVAVTFNGATPTTSREYTTYIVIPTTVTSPTSATPPSTMYQITSVDASAFYDCTGLDSVLLSSSITFIDSLAFGGCTKMKKCSMPSTINFIGEKAFYNCTALPSIDLPTNITKISKETFNNCTSLTGITIPDNVTKISDKAFNNCTNLTEVIMSNNVTEISNSAFNNCRALTSINISSSASIGERAFANCILLTSVNMSNPDTTDIATSIGDYAFSNCSSLQTINLSSAVTKVSSTAFLGCANLNINVDADNLALMADNGVLYSYLQDTLIFYPAKKQGTEFIAPNNLKSIGDYSFAYNLYLKNINLNDSLTRIGNYAFYNSTGLATVNIPKSVNYIGENAFYNCRNLDKITVTALNPPEIQESTFYNVPKSIPVYVPCYFLNDYLNSSWGDYFTNIQARYQYVVNLQGNINFSGNVAFVQEPTCQDNSAIIRATENSRCFRFIKWSDGNTENPRNVMITKDTTFIAEFEPINYEVILQNSVGGQAVMTLEANCENNYNAIIRATENECYRFVKWSDDNTDPVRLVTITKDTTFTAEFELINYAITAKSNNSSAGQASVTQEPTCENNYNAIIQATANSGYDFLRWEDNIIDNPRNVDITSDSTFTAIFEISAGIENLYDFDLKIFPNPVNSNGILNIENETLKAGDRIAIYDMNGKLISTHFATGVKTAINIGSLSGGTYILKLSDKKGIKFEVR